ncbi:DUF4232 domain-containing protein [Streptomyces virens]|jgi:hypothetical protein|uniref:Uncharacterized protein n=2 Tax=Streptomyces TaxID=1883 RepID=A0A514JSE1_9ACTN|nr:MULTISPECIES: DUF4232 domain-containing protein [Streptomyces]MBA8973948.1 hypothetical protein [Streptomyces calvus]MYS31753.1 DUF4232 domain-containing protein [Streptomyces sp. SID7804]QDI70274.1 hypothetical protein CD934_17395 [Streptomyces calvus]
MRASRIRLLAAAGITLATLSLTACQDGTGTKDEGASGSTASATTPADTSSDSPKDGTGSDAAQDDSASEGHSQAGGSKGTGSNTGNGEGGDKSAGSGTTSGSGDAETRVACNGSNTTVTVQPVSRPLNHMLITVKNTGSKPCDLTYYPVLRFDEMQWVPQPIEASKPQSVVGIAPGESAYAGALLASADGSGEGGTTGHKLTVGFQGRTPNSSGGPSATPSLPAKGVYYDSSMAVTYWQQSMDEALSH